MASGHDYLIFLHLSHCITYKRTESIKVLITLDPGDQNFPFFRSLCLLIVYHSTRLIGEKHVDLLRFKYSGDLAAAKCFMHHGLALAVFPATVVGRRFACVTDA